jgi:surface antigen
MVSHICIVNFMKDKNVMQASKWIAVIATTAMLSACAQPGGQGITQGGGGLNKQDIGVLGGAIGGGVIGSTMGGGAGKTAATIGGALLGGLLGSEIGKSLDNADRAAMSQTSQRALETAQPGEALPWKNSQTGNYGTVTPSNYYQNSEGQYCREYTQKIIVGGRTEEGQGTACRQPDGSWRIVQ